MVPSAVHLFVNLWMASRGIGLEITSWKFSRYQAQLNLPLSIANRMLVYIINPLKITVNLLGLHNRQEVFRILNGVI